MKMIKQISLLMLFGWILIAGMALAKGLPDKVMNATLETEYTKEKYPIVNKHEKLNFECATCHGEGAKSEYKKLSTQECLECHKSYQRLAERTDHLGYDDNIHASPHYPEMDCNLCHASHKPSINYCVMCHSQDSMKKIIVP
ncbi:cytochrome c3 family protein [Wolinella succinogenes]|uniref:cytochrome c3 family protein n=1 Tax=Wolinella succinogenes TaxID=844 RepID=UPI002FCA4ABB